VKNKQTASAFSSLNNHKHNQLGYKTTNAINKRYNPLKHYPIKTANYLLSVTIENIKITGYLHLLIT